MAPEPEASSKNVWLEDTTSSPGRQDLDIIGPPASIEPSMIYKLYRGAPGEVDGRPCRVWAEFPALQLCWAGYDLPARPQHRASLLDLAGCSCEAAGPPEDPAAVFRVDVFGPQPKGAVLRVSGASASLRDFAEGLRQLLACRDTEGRRCLEFIQKRLFQYLWKHQGSSRTEEALYEAQAVLAFNLEPKEGVAYLRNKLGKKSDEELGRWLAQMSTQKGGLDPTMLGNYFSRRDTLDVFRSFVRCLDFGGIDLVAALRQLFDTFKPGGEGQVITRILEYFAESYFTQWKVAADSTEPKTAFKDADSVLQVAVSLIMLNTGLHVATKKLGKRAGAAMTVEEYIENTRRVVSDAEVPEEALRLWYSVVRESEISVEPLPRAAFSRLPVQPDIEGWLLAVVSAHVQHRYWAVLALQRLYLFSDANDLDPCDAIDLKDMRVQEVTHDGACRERFSADLHGGAQCMCLCMVRNSRTEVLDAEARAFEVRSPSGAATMLRKHVRPRSRLALVAESPDLMEKWVTLISSGPY